MLVKLVLSGAALIVIPSMVAAKSPMQSAPVAAPAPPPVAGPLKARVKGDPNRMVCRELDTTGSRVNRKRDCRTAQAWAEQNAVDRQALEQQQANRWKND